MTYRKEVLTLLGLTELCQLEQGALVCERLHNTPTWLFQRRRPKFYLRENIFVWQNMTQEERAQALREIGVN
jgi:hypothetical protein